MIQRFKEFFTCDAIIFQNNKHLNNETIKNFKKIKRKLNFDTAVFIRIIIKTRQQIIKFL